MTDASATDFDDDSERTLLTTTPPRRRDARRDENGAVAPSVLGSRGRDDCNTPARRTLARTVTLNMGDVDASAELDSDFGFQSRRSGGGLLPHGATIAMNKPFESDDGETADGDVVIVLGKKGDAITHMAFYTEPMEIGSALLEKLNKTSTDGDMKTRFPGIEWVGIDKTNKTARNNYGLKPRGWFANTATCGSSRAVYNLTKKFAKEILNADACVNFTLANIELTDSQITASARMMNHFIGKPQLRFRSDWASDV